MALQAQDFIRKWRQGSPAFELNERAGAQAHFIDLCRVLGVPEPGDPNNYCFERGLSKTGGAAVDGRHRTDGFADVWLKGHFAWEYKTPGRSLAGAGPIAAAASQPDHAPMPPPLAQPLIDHRDEIVALCRACGVERAEFFASAADGRFDAQRSDYDFIVRAARRPQESLARRYLGFIDALEAQLGRRVDVLGDGPIENPYLRHAVNASRRVLHDEPVAETSA